MAPNKFEKQLKDTLERRTIAPSSNAWSRLDTQFDLEQQKRKFPIWWLGVAATFIGVFLAITFFNNENKPLDRIVNETKNEIITIENNNTNKNDVIVVEDQTIQNKTTSVETKVNKGVKHNKKVKTTIQNNNYTNKYQVKNVVITTINKQENKQVTPLVIQDKNQIEVIAVAVSTEDKASNKAYQEATTLLEAAYTKVAATGNTNNIEKIDANSMLEEVEIKSEKSLRNRLFHVVKSGYESVKTSVVERNN